MLHDILPTKLNIPQIRQRIVSRPRLLDKLNRGLDVQKHTFSGRLSLISAPAGFGKSTLVVDWVTGLARSLESRVCWLSLDEQENSSARFFSYLSAALQTADPALGQMVHQLLQAPESPPSEALMTNLIQDISRFPRPILLVLDDYHTVTTREIHKAISFLLENLPPNLHLVIITREDPMLPLAQLRAKRQMVEIRLADLRFTVEETAAFLRDVKGLQLRQEDVIALEARTEGWIAGLQLAALSLQQAENASEFIASFTGSSRYLLDYLFEEVLAEQSAELQTFLLHTSILSRFNAELCNAVTGQTDGVEILAKLHQANLFLIPLDENLHWFRYHHLFAELLRHHLRLTDADTAVLHRRAARWLQGQGAVDEAIPHFLAAQEWPQVAEALLSVSERMLRRGEAATLMRWMAQVPLDLIASQPQLELQYVWALIMTGQLEVAQSHLQNLAQKAEKAPDFLAQVLIAQAYIARTQYDGRRTIELSQRALTLLPKDQVSSRAVLALNLGIAHWHAGQLADAEKVLTEARFTAEQARNFYVRDMAAGFLGLVQGSLAQLPQVADMLQQVLALGNNSPTEALAHRVLGGLFYEWNDLDAAAEHLAQAEWRAEAIGNAELLIGILRNWALLKQAQGDNIGAVQSLSRLHMMSTRHQMAPVVLAGNAAVYVQVALAQGDMATAVHWAGQVTELVDGSPFYPQLHLTPARLFLAQDKKIEALQLLKRLYLQAQQVGWKWGMIEIRTLQALAAPDAATALDFLVEALRLAQPGRFIRTFLDKGTPMAALLQQVRHDRTFASYVCEILVHFPDNTAAQTPPAESAASETALADPLSDRELEILQMLREQYTNAEIAQELVLSVNTVKTHIKHIYEKLGVHNRKTAVSRARFLHLLPTEEINLTR